MVKKSSLQVFICKHCQMLSKLIHYRASLWPKKKKWSGCQHELSLEVSSAWNWLHLSVSPEIIARCQLLEQEDLNISSIVVGRSQSKWVFAAPFIVDHPLICSNHTEEADNALQQVGAIAQHYASHHKINLPEGKFENDPMHQAVQRNMGMYCIDVPVHSISWYNINFLANYSLGMTSGHLYQTAAGSQFIIPISWLRYYSCTIHPLIPSI